MENADDSVEYSIDRDNDGSIDETTELSPVEEYEEEILPGSISWNVYRDSNENGIKDEHEKKYRRAILILERTDGGDISTGGKYYKYRPKNKLYTRPNRDGSYSFEWLESWDYTLTLSLKKNMILTEPQEEIYEFTVSNGDVFTQNFWVVKNTPQSNNSYGSYNSYWNYNSNNGGSKYGSYNKYQK